MDTHYRWLLGSLACVWSLASWSYSQDADFRAQRSAAGIEILEADSKVLFFQTQEKSLDGKWPRANYVHPLYGLDGQVLTEDFPADHRHHRGIFWAWHQLRWQGQQMADPWICRDIQWLPPEQGDGIRFRAEGAQAMLEVTRDWSVPQQDPAAPRLRLVRENVKIVVHPVREGARPIDFVLKLRGLRPEVAIGGSEDVKGYGGFSPRLRLPEDLRFLAQTGPVEPQKTAVEGGAWMNFAGDFQQQPWGVSLLCHAANPDFPTKWILRAKNSMQNAAWPGREPVTLETEHDLVLRYRLLVHRGQLTTEQVNAAWKQFVPAAQQAPEAK